MRHVSTSSSSSRTLSGADLRQVCTRCLSLPEFICTPAQLCLTGLGSLKTPDSFPDLAPLFSPYDIDPSCGTTSSLSFPEQLAWLQSEDERP